MEGRKIERKLSMEVDERRKRDFFYCIWYEKERRPKSVPLLGRRLGRRFYLYNNYLLLEHEILS